MKNILLIFFLFASIASYGQTIELCSDSLYRVVMDNSALTDLGVGYNSNEPLLNEVFDSAEPNSPTMILIEEHSHAQLWSIIKEKGGRFLFKNYKTGRVIWTNKILPQDGISWSQASETMEWNNLAIGEKESKLYMGPEPADVNLATNITYFICEDSENLTASDNGYLFPNNVGITSLVFISYDNPISRLWSIVPCYQIGDPNIPADTSGTGVEDISHEKPFIQDGSNLEIIENCNIYNLSGVVRRNIYGIIHLPKGVYIVQKTATGATWKVFVP